MGHINNVFLPIGERQSLEFLQRLKYETFIYISNITTFKYLFDIPFFYRPNY